MSKNTAKELVLKLKSQDPKLTIKDLALAAHVTNNFVRHVLDKNPLPCPHCGQPLTHIEYQAYDDYEWNGDGYTVKAMHESANVICTKCEKDVSELFPEGPINYGWVE